MALEEPIIIVLGAAAASHLSPLSNPFTQAPNSVIYEARREFAARGLIRTGFKGRAAAAVFVENDTLYAMLALEPAAALVFAPMAKLSERRLWPPMTEDEVPHAVLTNARGETKTLKDRLTEIFEPFPDRDWHRGGKEQAERRALWRRVLTDALTDPAVRIVDKLNREHPGTHLTALSEWWCGKSPTFECRWDQTFYAPRTGARFLLEWQLKGRAHVPSLPMQSEETAPVPEVVYEDADILVVNKPPRLSSVPGVREKICAKTLLERTHGELFVVHRLDLDTSGVLLFARNKRSLTFLNEHFRSRTTHKVYEARLEKEIDAGSGRVDLALALNWLDRPRQCALPVEGGGKPCVTDYRVIGVDETVSGAKTRVELAPVTGRTHQLRLHCAMGLGVPIDGDPFYGHPGLEGETNATRLCLHAARLTVEHPSFRKTVTFEAPVRFPDF